MVSALILNVLFTGKLLFEIRISGVIIIAIGFHFDDIEAAALGYDIKEDDYEGQILVPIDRDKKNNDKEEIEVPPIGAPFHHD